MHTVLYIAPTLLGATTSPSSDSSNRNFFKTYNKICHNIHENVLVSILQNFKKFRLKLYKKLHKHNMLMKHQ